MGDERCLEPLTDEDLQHLSEVAQQALKNRIFQTPVGGLYSDRLLILTLCQGAAQHYIDGVSGVKDLDVWAFFREGPEKPFPWKPRWTADFGPSHLGRHPDDEGFDGRRIDVLGRSIFIAEGETVEGAVRNWLRGGTTSASFLIRKPVIGLFPTEFFRRIIWNPNDQP